ncbi:hypothetical protein H4R33_000704 [Dimargaris cristalligena]|nr:hypothetical protein H4R33_000704 [Dimargaris cristalligena]
MSDIQVSRLFVYPVKSCAGVPVTQAQVSQTGLQWDRQWMVTDENYKFLTQRQVGRMALVKPMFTGIVPEREGIWPAESANSNEIAASSQSPQLILTTTNSSTGTGTSKLPMATVAVPLYRSESERAQETPVEVQVWADIVPAYDEGNEVARWLSAFLGRPVRLVRYVIEQGQRRTKVCRPTSVDIQQARLQGSEVDPAGKLRALQTPPTPTGSGSNSSSDGDGDNAPEWPGRIMLSDDAPILMASELSLADLNERLETPVDIRHFRPNILINDQVTSDTAKSPSSTSTLSASSSPLSTSPSLLTPFQEETWCRITIVPQDKAAPRTSETNSTPVPTTLLVTSRCTRCVLTNNNPDTGIANPKHQPLKTLMSYRRVDPGDKYHSCFGMNCVPVRSGRFEELTVPS